MKPRKKHKSPFSIEGYKFNSPDRFRPFNIIDSGRITMKDVNMPLFAVDNEGNQGIMLPGEEYQFPGDRVLEVPLNLVPPQQKPYNSFVVNTPQNYVGGVNLRLPQNREIGAVGVLPKNPNPYFKGVADIGVRQNFNNYSVGANVGIPFAKNPNTGERTITPQVSFKYNFDSGGSLPKAQVGLNDLIPPNPFDTVDPAWLKSLVTGQMDKARVAGRRAKSKAGQLARSARSEAGSLTRDARSMARDAKALVRPVAREIRNLDNQVEEFVSDTYDEGARAYADFYGKSLTNTDVGDIYSNQAFPQGIFDIHEIQDIPQLETLVAINPEDYTFERMSDMPRICTDSGECASALTLNLLRTQGKNILESFNMRGSAWTMLENVTTRGARKISDIFESPDIPTSFDQSKIKNFIRSHALNKEHIGKLDNELGAGDIVALFYPDSPNYRKAFQESEGKALNTHIGEIVVINGERYVRDNVHGKWNYRKLRDVLTNNDSEGVLITGAAELKKTENVADMQEIGVRPNTAHIDNPKFDIIHNTAAYRAMATIKNNKQKLSEIYNLSDKEFNDLTSLAHAIMYKDSNLGKAENNAQYNFTSGRSALGQYAHGVKQFLTPLGLSDEESVGLGNVKVSSFFTPEEMQARGYDKILESYDLRESPEFSGLVTFEALARTVPAVKERLKDLPSEIKNDQRLVDSLAAIAYNQGFEKIDQNIEKFKINNDPQELKQYEDFSYPSIVRSVREYSNYNMRDGGSLPKAQTGGWQPSRTITVDTSTPEGLKRMQAYQDSTTMHDRSIVADALFNDLLKKHGVDPEKQFESYEHLPDNEFHNFSEGDTWFQTFDLERGKKRALSQEQASAFAEEVQNKIKFNQGPFPYGFEGGLHDLERWGLWDLMHRESISHRPIEDPDDEGYYITQDFFWRPKLQPPPNVRVVEAKRPEESLVNLPVKKLFSEDKPPREVLSRLNPVITNMGSYGSGQGVILEMSDGQTLRMPKKQFAQFRKMGNNEKMIQDYRLLRKNGGPLPKFQNAREIKAEDLVPRDPFSALSPAQREAFNASTVAAMKAEQERQLEEYMRRSPGGDLFPDQGLKPITYNEEVSGWFPVAGEYIDAKNTGEALKRGDYVDAGFNAAGFLLPFIPGSFLKRQAKEFLPEIDLGRWGKFNEAIPDNKILRQEYAEIEKMTKANNTWMKNPDGSPFKGTPEQFVQQQSENFKRAFGDSKLVNPDGSPLFLYHGSAKKFDTFDPSKFQLGDAGYSGRGIYTTPTKKTADGYSFSSAQWHSGDIEPTVYQLYGQGNRPIKSSDLIKENQGRDLFDFYRDRNSRRELSPYESLREYDVAIHDQLPDVLNIRPLHHAREIVFPKNTQLKSAVGNDGMFDMTNPNIYKRLGGSLPKAQEGKEGLYEGKYVPYGSPEYRKAYREGRVQGQILPEIDVVAERPDYAADVQRAFGAFVTAPFAGAFNAMTVPQALAVEQMERMRGRPYNYANAFDINPLDNPVSKGVFGTDQRLPSQALEIENPAGAFALDAFTDPLGFFGGKSLVQTGARRLGNALKSGTKAGVKDLADPTNARALTDAQASQIKSRLVKKPGILDQIVQKTNQTKRAIKDHKVGLQRGIRELKDPDGRSFSEVFPITKKQRLNIMAKQDAAAKEADDFARLYVTEDGKRLTAPMRNVLNAWGSPGVRRDYIIYSGEQDLFKNHTPILTETRSRRLNPDLSPRQVKYIKNNRSSFGGVDMKGNRPMTVRNYGFYFRPPEAVAGTVAHEFAHKVPQQLWIPNPHSIGTTKLSRRMSPWAYADEAGEGYKYHVHPRYHSDFDALSQEGPFAVSEAEKALGMSSTQYPGFDYDLGAFYGLKNHKVSQRAFDNLKVPTKVSKGKDNTYQTWLAAPLEVGAEKMKARYFSFKNLQKQNPNLTPKEFLKLDEIADRFDYLEGAPRTSIPRLQSMLKMQGADWDIIKQIQDAYVNRLQKHFKGYDQYGRPIKGEDQISPEEIHKTLVNFQTGGSTYKIKPGDTLSQIANRFGTSVQELVDLNKINDPNLIIANQTLNLPSAQAVAPQPSTVQPAAQASSIQPSATPAQNQNVYTVRSGDTLGQIAKAHKTTVKRLAKINNISDPNKIFPNQEIVLPQNFVPIKPVQKEAWHDIDELNNSNQKINQLSDEEIVLKAQTLADPNERFVVVDKKNKMFKYYQGDHVLMEFEIITGKNKGDAQTVTKAIDINKDGIITDADRVDGEFKVDWSMGNLNTGAGKYTIDQSMATTDYDGYYQYAPSFTLLNERGTPVGTAIHGTPKYREKFFGNNILDDNRQSSGCINGKCTDIQALYDMGLAKGTSVYILPEDAGNRFEFVDGQAVLRMSRENREKYAGAYTDEKGREQTGQGGNYSVNTLKYKPIRPKFDEKTFKEKVFQSSDNNDEQELAETTMPFINALVENKQAIMKEARIPGDVYNQIARMAFGIYGTESNFGDTHSGAGNFMRALNKFTNRQNASSPDVVSKYYTYNQKADNNSVGYTQIRWSFLNDDEKKALSNLGITSNEDFLDPTKSAIATAAILGIRYNQQLKPSQKKDMWKHLPGKWNNRKNYSDRVFQNSRYLTFEQLDKLQTGGEINHLDMYSGYVQGKYDGTEDEKSAKDIYDKLNRVYYNEAKLAGTSVPNYIMSYMMDGRA